MISQRSLSGAPGFLASILVLLAGVAHAGGSSSETAADTDVEVTNPRASTVWAQWRGPQRDGSAPEAELPADLSRLEQKWRVPLGKGYPGPIVDRDSVYVVETVDSETEGVRALDRTTGEERWRTTWPGSGKVPFFAKKNGDWVRSTPALADGALYVGGMQEVLHKLDALTGEILWTVDFPARFETRVPDFGFSSSPLVIGGAVYVQAANSLVKLEAETGEVVWRSLANDGNIMVSGAFSSPMLATVGGRELLLVQTRTHLNGVEQSSGEVVFSREVPSFRGMNILTPTVYEDKIFTSSYRNKTHLFEVGSGDGQVELSEVWNYKSSGYMSSPVIIDGHAYLHLGNGRFTCIDLESGESRWTSEPLGDYSSLIAVGDRILALQDSGELLLIGANPDEFELISRREVSEQSTWGHLALVDDQLFVRELEAVSVFDLGSRGR